MWTDGRYIFRKSIPEMVQAASPQKHPGNVPGSWTGGWRDSSRKHAAEPFPGTLQTVCPESCPATPLGIPAWEHSGNHASGLQGVPSKNHL